MGFALQIADTFYRAFGAGGAVDLAVALSALGKLPTWRYSPRWRRRVRREPLKVLSYFRLLQSYPRLSPQEKRRKRLRQTDLSSVFRLFFSDSWVQCTPPTTLWERGVRQSRCLFPSSIPAQNPEMGPVSRLGTSPGSWVAFRALQIGF
jgi:hypothetical protein